VVFQNKFLDNVAILGLFFAIIAIMYTVFKDVLSAVSFSNAAPVAFGASVILAVICVFVVGRMSKESEK
jgi:uncharacterized membrane protein